MTRSHPSRPIRTIAAAALGAAALVATAASSLAADLSLVPQQRAARVTYAARVTHVRTLRVYRNWRERCAYAGYYCLYAEYGTVYHYPFDDRPVAYAHRRR